MNKKGFTLTELLVVIVIMGIVSGLSIPLIRGVAKTFEDRKYNTYVKAVLAAAKIYNDSYEEDLFGRKEYGCSYITYEKLEEKDLIKDIEIDDISCATNKTFVRVIKLGEKYGYSGTIGCGEEEVENGVTTVNVIDKTYGTPMTLNTEACTGSAENNISIKIDKSQVGNTFDKKKRSTKITLESGTGIDPNASLKYAWSTTPDGFGSATYNSVSFSSIASASNQETNLLKGISTTVTSSKIETPTATGTYYLLVRVDSLNDIYGGTWKNTLEVGKGKVVATSNNYISYGPFAIDNSAPTTPTVTGYKKTSSTDVTSVEGLSTLASNTWYSGWAVVNATGSTDNSTVNYYYKATGATTNTDGFVKNSIRNVDAEGTSTLKFKACDLAGNCSSEVTFTVKLDRTAPSAPTVTGYKKTSSTDVTSVSGLSTLASNTWYSGWIVVKATGSTDTNGVTYYYSATGATTNTDGFVTGDIRNVDAEGTSTIKFKTKDAAGNWSSEVTYTAKLDRTAPSAPTVTGYKKTSSDNVSSSTGLSTIATNTWTKDYLFVVASGSTDSISSVSYYSLTTTGQGSVDVTDSHQSTRNVNTEGTATLKYKACDAAGNCSGATTFISKQDRTGPTVPTSVLRYDSSSGTVRTNANTCTNKTLWWGSFSATDASTSVDHYEYSTGCTGSKSNNLNPDGYTYSNDTNYTFCIRAVDTVGNPGSWSSPIYIRVDKTAPSAPTVTGYKKTSSTDISSSSGLSSIATNTWTDKFLYVVASGSSDSASNGVNYKMTVSGYPSGNSNNVTDAAQSTKNVNTAGTITVQYKACDNCGNCSGYTSFVSKQDRTAPNAPTVTGYKKTSSTDISSSSGLSSIATNTWTDKFLYVVASGSSDSGGAGGVNYKMTVSGYPSGNSNNVTDAAQSTKNVNSAGTITVQYKACDSVGNCSGYTSFVSKQDRTAPTCSVTDDTNSSSSCTSGGRTIKVTCSDTGGSNCASSGDDQGSRTLKAAGTYNYSVKDAAGNSKSCSKVTITTGTYTNYTSWSSWAKQDSKYHEQTCPKDSNDNTSTTQYAQAGCNTTAAGNYGASVCGYNTEGSMCYKQGTAMMCCVKRTRSVSSSGTCYKASIG